MIAATMPTMREVLETTIALEKQTMALYARFARAFAKDPALHDFWFDMARDEARHVGALDLVSTVLGFEGVLDKASPVSLENSTLVRLREILDKYSRESEMPIDRALAAALEVEETELEDLVGDLLKAVQHGDEYERYLRLLVHDLGELSYMIEQHCHNPALLQRCDALVNRHAEALRRAAVG
jgi:rubrerythrin